MDVYFCRMMCCSARVHGAVLAEASFLQLIEGAGPAHRADLLAVRAGLLGKLGRDSDAMADAKAAVDQDPENAKALHVLACVGLAWTGVAWGPGSVQRRDPAPFRALACWPGLQSRLAAVVCRCSRRRHARLQAPAVQGQGV